jgi:protein MpaA
MQGRWRWERPGRREFLKSLAIWSFVPLAGQVAGAWPVRAAQDTTDGPPLSGNGYGASREQRPLVDLNLGHAYPTALIVGGIHAGSEANTVAVVQELLSAIELDPGLVPPGLGLTFLTAANPDGLANGTRTLSSGVDPNRNWPTADWSIDTYVSGPTLVRGGGGPFPLSEPETQALARLVTQSRPSLIVAYHSAAGLVTGGPQARAMGLEAAYAKAAGYSAGDWTAYPVTGDFAQWAEQQGIPTIDVELPDHANTHLAANLAGLGAILWKL